MRQGVFSRLLAVTLLLSSTIAIASPLNGNYTIGAGGDYAAINEACVALSSGGVSGPVVFEILPGIYTNDLLNVYNVAGVSEVNRITFRSSTGNPNDVILERAGTACIIQVSYVTIEALTMKQLNNWSFPFGPDFGRVLEVVGFTEDVRIVGNTLIGADYVSTIQDKYAVISASQYLGGALQTDLKIIGNDIQKGSVGIYLGGSSLVTGTGLEVVGNTITEYRWHGIYIEGRAAPLIKSNYVSAMASSIGASFTYPYAMIMDECSGAAQIEGNHFQSPYYLALSLECNATPSARGKFINNIVKVDSAATNGLNGSGLKYFDIHHNTFVISGRWGSSAALDFGGPFGGPYPEFDVQNNIFANFGEGVALSITFPDDDVIACDYNVFYSAAGTMASHLTYTIDTTLADWQAAWGLDLNSVEADPQFQSYLDLTLSAGSPARNLGVGGLVATDIDAGMRDATPDAGADEYGVAGCDHYVLSGAAACPLANGTASVIPIAGAGPYTYLWSDGSTVASRGDMIGGSYTVTVMDAAGCSWNTTVDISCAAPPAPVSLSAGLTHALCFGDCNGAIDMIATGGCLPFSFEFKPIGGAWQPASTSAVNPCLGQETGLCAGVGYGLRVTDACGNADSLFVDITEPDKLIPALIDRTHISCYEFEDGEIIVSATGGTPPYLFSNNAGGDFSSSGTFANLGQDNYPMVVQDANGCFRTGNLNIKEPAELLLGLVGTLDETSPGAMDGGLRVQSGGGTGDKEYSINMGTDWQSSRTFPGLSAGLYEVWVQDENSCITELLVTVNPALLRTAAQHLTLSPNPARSYVMLTLGQAVSQNTVVEVLDQQGKVRSQTEIQSGNTSVQIPLADFAAGMYFIQLQDAESSKMPLLVVD